jgi:hypothetical protein
MVSRITTVATTATAVGGQFTLGAAAGYLPEPNSFHSPFVIRPGEIFAANWGGAALPAGFIAYGDMVWTESDI